MQEVCIYYQACAHFLFKSSIWGVGNCSTQQRHPLTRDLQSQLSLPSHSIFFSPNNMSMDSLHMGINGMQKASLPFHLSYHPSAIMHWLPGYVCLSILCYLETLSRTESSKSSSPPKPHGKVKETQTRDCAYTD